MPFGEHSIKRKLVGVILLTSLSALVFTCLVLFAYEIRQYRHATASSLSTIADIVCENSTAVLLYDDQKDAQELLAGLRVEPTVSAAALYDENGRIFSTYPAGIGSSFFPARLGPDGMDFHLRHVTIIKPVIQGDVRAGTLYLVGNFGGTYRQLLVYGLVLVGVVAISGAVALLLSNFFQRRISAPLLELARTAHDVSARKDYSVRARKVSNDEIGDLTEAFNGMLDQIQAGHSSQRQVEAALTRARDEAVSASRAKDDFLAALSHELRTPLNPVLLLASDAAEDGRIPEPLRRDFDTIRKNVELEARLIDDLLDLTRIARGKIVLDRRSILINNTLRDALVTVRGEIESKPIQLSLELDAADPQVLGDGTRLQQVFWNVLKNAAKFTPPGGRISVASRVSPGGRSVTVEVRDTGMGMTEAEIGRAFEAFSQGDHAGGRGSHRFGGLGLGLAISRAVVDLHGGRIRASSEGRGRGCTFTIELPLERGPAG